MVLLSMLGTGDRDIAAEMSVTTRTVRRWRGEDWYKALVRQEGASILAITRRSLLALIPEVVDAIQRALNNDEDPKLSVDTAWELLDRVGLAPETRQLILTAKAGGTLDGLPADAQQHVAGLIQQYAAGNIVEGKIISGTS